MSPEGLDEDVVSPVLKNMKLNSDPTNVEDYLAKAEHSQTSSKKTRDKYSL